MKIPEEFWYGISSLPTTILLLVKRRKTPGCYDGRAESIVREIYGLCPRTSNHYGVPDIPE